MRERKREREKERERARKEGVRGERKKRANSYTSKKIIIHIEGLEKGESERESVCACVREREIGAKHEKHHNISS